MWRDALLVAGKDLRIEIRSRVALNQVAAVRRGRAGPVRLRPRARPAPMGRGPPACSGWRSCSAAVLAVQRSVAVESADGARDGLRLSGLDPAGIFLGKAAAVAVQLVVLEVVLAAGVVLLYGAHRPVRWPVVAACARGGRRAGRGGHAVRGAVRRGAGPRDPAAFPAAAGGGPRSVGRDPGLAGGAGRRHAATGDPWLASWSSSPSSTWLSASSSSDPSRSRHDPAGRRPSRRWRRRRCPGRPDPGYAALVGWPPPCGSASGSPRPTRCRATWCGWSTSIPPVAWVALYLAFGLAALGSLL